LCDLILFSISKLISKCHIKHSYFFELCDLTTTVSTTAIVSKEQELQERLSTLKEYKSININYVDLSVFISCPAFSDSMRLKSSLQQKTKRLKQLLY